MRQEGIIYSSVSWNSFKTFWLSSVFRHGMCLVDFLSLFLFLITLFFFFFELEEPKGWALTHLVSEPTHNDERNLDFISSSGPKHFQRGGDWCRCFPPKHPCWGWKVIRRWCVTKKPHYIILPDMTDDSGGSVLLSLRIISTLKKKSNLLCGWKAENLAGKNWETGVLQS